MLMGVADAVELAAPELLLGMSPYLLTGRHGLLSSYEAFIQCLKKRRSPSSS